MPGSTSLGIRYPFQNETVTNTSWQNMASDVDGLLTQLSALQVQTVNPSTAQVVAIGTSATLATGVTGNLTFTAESWDTAGYADLVANNDRFTVPPGVYYVCINYNWNTVTTTTGIQTVFLVGGTTWGGYTMGNIAGVTTNSFTTASNVIVATSTTSVQVQVRWNGTGGPAVFQDATFVIIKIRDLFNV